MKHKILIEQEETQFRDYKYLAMVGMGDGIQLQIQYDEQEAYINMTRLEVMELRDNLIDFLDNY